MFAGRFVSTKRYTKKPVNRPISPICPKPNILLSLRNCFRKYRPTRREWKCVFLLLSCLVGLAVYIMVERTDQAQTHPSLTQELRPSPSLFGIGRQVQQYVQKMMDSHMYLSASDSGEKDRRTPKQVIWNNNLLYFHKVQYNFNASAERQDVVLQKVRVPKLGTFGEVIIAYNSSQEVTNRTAELSDTIYVPPADYICIHTPSPLDNQVKVVLATTMFFPTSQTFITNNTIRNWARLRPYVQPVLYITPSSTQPHGPSSVRLACSLGWDVYIVPESSTSNFPVLRTMVEDARQKYSAPMLGYANGDILFDSTLPATLDFCLRHHHKFIAKKYHLVTGQRKDIRLQPGTNLFTPEHVAEKAKSEGKYHGSLGFDYFFSTRDGFPWRAIPPFVIGRPVFDNWLVWWSIMRNGPTICLDASQSITAVHQQARGAKAGWKHRNVDLRYNANMVPAFPVRHGNTDCISRKIIRLNDRHLEVRQAKIRPENIVGCKAFVKEGSVLFQGDL